MIREFKKFYFRQILGPFSQDLLSYLATLYNNNLRSAISSLRNLRDNPSYIRAASPPTKGGTAEESYNGGSQKLTSGVCLLLIQ